MNDYDYGDIYDDGDIDVLMYVANDHGYDGNDIIFNDHNHDTFGFWLILMSAKLT